MPSIDVAWSDPFSPLKGLLNLSDFAQSTWSQCFSVQKKPLKPLSGCKPSILCFSYLWDALLNISDGQGSISLWHMKDWCQIHEIWDVWRQFLGINMPFCTSSSDAPNLSCNSLAMEIAQQIPRGYFLPGVLSFRPFPEENGIEEAACKVCTGKEESSIPSQVQQGKHLHETFMPTLNIT